MSRLARRWPQLALALVFAGCGPSYVEVDDPPPPIAECPRSIPTVGEPCYSESWGQSCYYELSSCPGAFVQAFCDEGMWALTRNGVTCGGDGGVDGSVPDAVPEAGADASLDSGVCPSVEPVGGAACSGALRCEYENLCPLIALKTNAWRCAGGKWSFENTLESEIACPTAAPRDGQACGCAMYLPSKCAYVTACGKVDATCDGATQKWTVGACPSADAGPTSTDAAPSSDASADAPSSDAAPVDSSSADAGDAATEDVAAAAPDAAAASDAAAEAAADAVADAPSAD